MRALAGRLSARLPQASYDGVDLVVGDLALAQDAQRLLDRARAALDYAASQDPAAYARLRQDVRTVVLGSTAEGLPYNRFQLAVLVPAEVASEAPTPAYAAWLLYASGLSRGTAEARARADGVLQALAEGERGEALAWLPAAG
jgi:hypothetical protein